MAGESPRTSPLELAGLFLKLGATSFGGPVAHIARMRDEFVDRRGWITPERFLDMMGLVNLIPGPSSTQLAIEIGYEQAGWPGLIAAGICFIAPAMLMVLIISAFYIRYGSLPQMQSILMGTQPIVLAIIAQALARFARTAVNGGYKIGIAAVTIGLLLLHEKETTALAVAAALGILAGVIVANRDRAQADAKETDAQEVTANLGAALPLAAVPLAPTLGKLFLFFLKIGCIIYGSGYVLLAFLRDDLVKQLQWLSDKELLDAIAVGQVTPGPVFTTATFVGYLVGTRFHLGAYQAAFAATLGIFLPSFFLVALLSLTIRRWKDSHALRKFLDSVNAASVVLMAEVTLQLAQHVFMTPSTDYFNIVPLAMGAVALLILTLTPLNAVWLLLGGAALGYFVGLR